MIEASHHEAWHRGSMRLIFSMMNRRCVTADNIMTFKLAVKTIAKRHGLHATFMPKPKSRCQWFGYAYQYVTCAKTAKIFLQDETDRFGLSQDAY